MHRRNRAVGLQVFLQKVDRGMRRGGKFLHDRMQMLGAVVHVHQDRLDTAQSGNNVPGSIVKVAKSVKFYRNGITKQPRKILHSLGILVGTQRKHGIVQKLECRLFLQKILICMRHDMVLPVGTSDGLLGLHADPRGIIRALHAEKGLVGIVRTLKMLHII